LSQGRKGRRQRPLSLKGKRKIGGDGASRRKGGFRLNKLSTGGEEGIAGEIEELMVLSQELAFQGHKKGQQMHARAAVRSSAEKIPVRSDGGRGGVKRKLRNRPRPRAVFRRGEGVPPIEQKIKKGGNGVERGRIVNITIKKGPAARSSTKTEKITR